MISLAIALTLLAVLFAAVALLFELRDDGSGLRHHVISVAYASAAVVAIAAAMVSADLINSSAEQHIDTLAKTAGLSRTDFPHELPGADKTFPVTGDLVRATCRRNPDFTRLYCQDSAGSFRLVLDGRLT